jgi:hypothetical protein
VKHFFQRNIDNRGRLVRGIGSLFMAVGGVVAGQFALWAGIALVLVAGFVLFEAVRGWCVMRACGIRTRL